MDGQITIDEWLETVKPLNCKGCEHEKIDSYHGLSMCRHPLVMKYHSRTRGKFSSRWFDEDYPEWCPIKDPKRWR